MGVCSEGEVVVCTDGCERNRALSRTRLCEKKRYMQRLGMPRAGVSRGIEASVSRGAVDRAE